MIAAIEQWCIETFVGPGIFKLTFHYIYIYTYLANMNTMHTNTCPTPDSKSLMHFVMYARN